MAEFLAYPIFISPVVNARAIVDALSILESIARSACSAIVLEATVGALARALVLVEDVEFLVIAERSHKSQIGIDE